MPLHSVTLDLPDAVLHRAQQAANTLNLSLEDVLVDVLTAGLPEVIDAPAEMQAELARMTWLDERGLWEIANSQMADEAQDKLRQLSELQGQRGLAEEEKQELEALRREYGRATLRKARAYALLSMRSGRPLLAHN